MALVSIVLATRDRPEFFALASRYYAYQTHPETELIVVDDGMRPAQIHPSPDVRHLRLNQPQPLGTKLNIGVDHARGRFVLKMDDDDFYAPTFVASMFAGSSMGPASAVSFLQPFLFLELRTLAVRQADPGRCSGATLFFRRSLWRDVPFRDVHEAVDAFFLEDHGVDVTDALTFRRVRACELFLQVRHGDHTWTHMPWGERVDDYVARMPLYSKTAAAILPGWALKRYRAMAASCA